MSTQRSPVVKYHCMTGCEPWTANCPNGHELLVLYHLTSDTVSVEIDGQHVATFDESGFQSIIEADRLYITHRSSSEEVGPEPTDRMTSAAKSELSRLRGLDVEKIACEIVESFNAMHPDSITDQYIEVAESILRAALNGEVGR